MWNKDRLNDRLLANSKQAQAHIQRKQNNLARVVCKTLHITSITLILSTEYRSRLTHKVAINYYVSHAKHAIRNLFTNSNSLNSHQLVTAVHSSSSLASVFEVTEQVCTNDSETNTLSFSRSDLPINVVRCLRYCNSRSQQASNYENLNSLNLMISNTRRLQMFSILVYSFENSNMQKKGR